MPEGFYSVKKENSDSPEASVLTSEDHYPFGTQLMLDTDAIGAMGIDGLNIGDVVEIRAFAFVESKNEHQSKEESEKRVHLQLTEMDVKKREDDRAKQLYGE